MARTQSFLIFALFSLIILQVAGMVCTGQSMFLLSLDDPLYEKVYNKLHRMR